MTTELENLLESADARTVERLEALPTPLLAVDAETMLANLRAMAGYARDHGLNLRPHIKTHKTRLLAQLQLALGATGLTCAKPSEALAVAPDADDVLLAYPAFTPERVKTLATLVRTRRVRIAVDSIEAAERINELAGQAEANFGLLVDIDVGHHRTGTQSTVETVALAKRIGELPTASFDGILFFPGHLVPSNIDMDQAIRGVAQCVADVTEALRDEGMPAKIVSGGSTPAAAMSHRIESLTEIRPGTYIFNDVNSVRWDCATVDSCAATVHATVVSTAVAGKAVIDAGSKMLSSDLCGAAPESGFGLLVDHPEARLARLSEEHGEIELGQSDWNPQVGERVRVVPNHVCPCVNLQEELILRMPGEECFALRVDGRGRVK